MSVDKTPKDFDVSVVYKLLGEHVCGRCIRSYFETYNDSDLRKAKKTNKPITACELC